MMVKIGWHNWRIKEYWYPSIDAKIVEGNVTKKICRDCGKEELLCHFDWKEEQERLK